MVTDKASMMSMALFLLALFVVALHHAQDDHFTSPLACAMNGCSDQWPVGWLV